MVFLSACVFEFALVLLVAMVNISAREKDLGVFTTALTCSC